MSAVWIEAQGILRRRGYGLGSSGPNGDGVDGDPGELTAAAVLAELKRCEPMAGAPPASRSAVDLINVKVLRAACPERPGEELAALVEPIKAACRRFEINTVRRVAAFIAQMAHESKLQSRSENLNYSVDALLSMFGRHRISEADARRLGRTKTRAADQEAIANLIYGGDYGRRNLGNTEPGDGWRFRGEGPLQNTGRGNRTRFAEAMSMSLEQAEQFIKTPAGGFMSAAWFWEANDINRLADTPGVSDETRAINGGENGLEDRRQRFDRTVDALLAEERGP